MTITLAFLAGAICATVSILLVAAANMRRIERERDNRTLRILAKRFPQLQ